MERLINWIAILLRIRHTDWQPDWDSKTRSIVSRRWNNGAWEVREATDAEKDDLADQQTW